MKTTETKLQQLAGEVSAMFTVKERLNSKDEKFWVVKDGSPKWVTEMCHKAHAGMMPDDFKYDFIVNALDALRDYDDPDSIQDEMESDPYNSDLLKWVSSNLNRAEYVNEAVKDFGIGKDFDLFNVLGLGQYQEKCEVLGIVRQFLEDQI